MMTCINVTEFVLISIDWNASFEKCCNFYSNNWTIKIQNNLFKIIIYTFKMSHLRYQYQLNSFSGKCLSFSAMVLIHLLTMHYKFFFLYGYHSSYQLLENYQTKHGDDYFHYFVNVWFFITFVIIYNALFKTPLSFTYVRFITIILRICRFKF